MANEVTIRLTSWQLKVCEMLAENRNAQSFVQKLFDNSFERMRIEMLELLTELKTDIWMTPDRERISKDLGRVSDDWGKTNNPVKCYHSRTETFEDGAMYRCLDCGADGIVGSGREPV